MLKTLLNFGFKAKEAQVYVFLALNGPQKAKNTAAALGMNKRQIYRILKKFRDREIINVTPKRSAPFSAVSFDKVLDILIKVNINEANSLEDKKDQILVLWRSTIERQTAI
jgi:sugar-specific transcriptional regulator TrmB